jgi:hypothetical protein
MAGIGRRRELDQAGRGQVAAEQAGQPGDRAAGGEQVHLDAPPAGLGQRRDQEPVGRVEDQPVGDTQDDVAGAGDVGHLPRLADAEPEGAEHGIGRAQDHRDRAAAQLGGRLGPQRTGGGAGSHGGQLRGGVAGRAGWGQTGGGQAVGAPAGRFQLVTAVAGGGARVGGQLTGQPGEQVVLGRGDRRGGGRAGRIDLGDPGEHRQQVAAVDPLTGQPVQLGGAAALAELIAQVVGPGVLPGDGRPGRLAGRAQGDEGGKHAGQADGPPAAGGDRLAELGHDLLRRAQPVGGVLLVRPGGGLVRGVAGAGAGQDRAGSGERHRLEPGGAEIQPDADRVGAAGGHANGGSASSSSTRSP